MGFNMAILGESTMAGAYGRQFSGEAHYRAFIPKQLPPDPRVEIDQETWKLLFDADSALGRLDGVTETVPNHDPFLRRDACLQRRGFGGLTQACDCRVFYTISRSSM